MVGKRVWKTSCNDPGVLLEEMHSGKSRIPTWRNSKPWRVRNYNGGLELGAEPPTGPGTEPLEPMVPQGALPPEAESLEARPRPMESDRLAHI